jgi:hypothetical protein
MIKTRVKLLLLLFISSLSLISFGQASKNDPKPYKLLSSGRQITIKSSKNIRHVMLWTTGGNRVAEQKEINASQYVLDITVPQKTFFLMIAMSDGKVFTEKIGIGN